MIDDSSEAGNITAKIKAIFFNKSFHPSTIGVPDDTSFGLILDRTSFYAEAGGQEYDTGNIVIDGIADFEVTNVQVFNGYVLHIGRLKYGTLEVGNEVVSSFDEVMSSSHCRILNSTELKYHSFDDGQFVITTPLLTFSIFVSVKFLGII